MTRSSSESKLVLVGFRIMALTRILWICLLSGCTVFAQNNPFIPVGETFRSVSVRLTYRTASETFGPVCGQTISVSGAVTDIRLQGALGGGVFRTALVRTQPEVLIVVEDGTDQGAYYTLMILDQSVNNEAYGTETEPFVNWLVVNVQRSNIVRALSVVPCRAIIPDDSNDSQVTVLLYLQNDRIPDATVSNFTNGGCGDPIRCRFQVNEFVQFYNMTLKYADSFSVEADQYAMSVLSLIDESYACMMLWNTRLTSNPLLAGPDKLPFYLSLRFCTSAVTMGPLCSRAFQYNADDIEVAWKTIKPIPARKVRSLPEVRIAKSQNQYNMTGKMYTLMYVDQSTELNGGSDEMPFVHWMVTNIEGTDVSSGDCIIPYIPPFLTSGNHRMTLLMYSQTEEIEVTPGDFSLNGSCPLQYRCGFNVSGLLREHNLEPAGGLSFLVSADPVSISYAVESKIISTDDACPKLFPFNSEGRMLGECSPRFDMWRNLQSQYVTCSDEPHRMMLVRRMNSVCPELGSGFTTDVSFGSMDYNTLNAQVLQQTQNIINPNMAVVQNSNGWFSDYRSQQYNLATAGTGGELSLSDQHILNQLVTQYGCVIQAGCSAEIQPMVVALLTNNVFGGRYISDEDHASDALDGGYGTLAQNCIQADGTLNIQQLVDLLGKRKMMETIEIARKNETEIREEVEMRIRENKTEEIRSRLQQEMSTKLEAELSAQIEAQVRLEIEEEERRVAEERSRAEMEFEIQAKREADLQAELQAQLMAQLQAELQAHASQAQHAQMVYQAAAQRSAAIAAQQQERQRAEEEARLREEVEEKIRAEAELVIKEQVEAEVRRKVETEVRARMEAELERSMKIQQLQMEQHLERSIQDEVDGHVQRELSLQLAQHQENVLATRQVVEQANQLQNCQQQMVQVVGNNNYCGVNQILALNTLVQPNMAANLGTNVLSGMRTNFVCNACGAQPMVGQVVLGQYNQCSMCGK